MVPHLGARQDLRDCLRADINLRQTFDWTGSALEAVGQLKNGKPAGELSSSCSWAFIPLIFLIRRILLLEPLWVYQTDFSEAQHDYNLAERDGILALIDDPDAIVVEVDCPVCEANAEAQGTLLAINTTELYERQRLIADGFWCLRCSCVLEKTAAPMLGAMFGVGTWEPELDWIVSYGTESLPRGHDQKVAALLSRENRENRG